MVPDFWKHFWSGDNTTVNSMTVLAIALASPFATVALGALLYDIFWLGKGLTSQSVQLISIALGAATGGMGASLFSRTTISQTVGRMNSIGPISAVTKDTPAIRPDDPDAGKEAL